MKSTTVAAVLAWALAACGNSREPAGPSAVESIVGLSKAQPGYDAAAAAVVVGDVEARVLPTLTSGAAFAALESRVAALATALLQENWAVLRDYVDAARQALKEYGAGAPDQEEPELEGVDVALDHVAEGLPSPSGGGKHRGRGG